MKVYFDERENYRLRSLIFLNKCPMIKNVWIILVIRSIQIYPSGRSDFFFFFYFCSSIFPNKKVGIKKKKEPSITRSIIIFNKRIKFGKNFNKNISFNFSEWEGKRNLKNRTFYIKEYKEFTKGSIFRPIFFPIFRSPLRSSRCTFAKRCQCIDGGLKRAFLAGLLWESTIKSLKLDLSWNRAEQAWSRR